MRKGKAKVIQIQVEPWDNSDDHDSYPQIFTTNVSPRTRPDQYKLSSSLYSGHPTSERKLKSSNKNSSLEKNGNLKHQKELSQVKLPSESQKKAKQSSTKVNFMKRNLDIMHWSQMTKSTDQNLQTICSLYELKKPIINVTQIGYWEDLSMTQNCIKKRNKIKFDKISKSISVNKTSKQEAMDSEQRQKSHSNSRKGNQFQQKEFHQFCDKDSFEVKQNTEHFGHHLQKVLKIKDKLSKRTRSNSIKIDKVKMLIKNQAEKQRNQKQCFPWHPQPEQRMTFSSVIAKRNSRSDQTKTKNNDKWKDYVKFKFENKRTYEREKGRNLFSVMGGAIYK